MSGIGEIEIKLDGKIETLRPVLAAGLRVNDEFGDLTKAANRIHAGDLRAYISVVAAGLNKKKAEVEAAVFKTGLPTLAKELVKFINNLANGGKPFAPVKLKTVEIDGNVYAEVKVNSLGEIEPVYEEAPVEDAPAGEG